MKKEPFGEIDRQASPTNVHPMPGSRGDSGRAMGDLDEASSPGFPNPDQSSGFIKHAIYGSETPKSMAQDAVNSHMGSHAGFMDPVAQHVKLTKERQHHVRNTALNEAETQHGEAGKQVPYQHGDPEY